jgi:hypothetical protein
MGHMRRERPSFVVKPEGKIHLEDMQVDGKITKNCTLDGMA